MAKSDFAAIFAELRRIMLDSAAGMIVAADRPGVLEMEAPWPHPAKPELPMWFGAVRAGKAYVAYHLMPVYSHPELVGTISADLRRHMQGKSCFNFRSLEPALLAELGPLTAAAARAYARPFRIPTAASPG
jgi:hypothetical protein